MRRLLAVLLTAILAGVASGQNITEMKARLQQPSANGGFVTITEDSGVGSAVASADAATTVKVDGFRVVVFMGNSESARGEAVSSRDRFLSIFPGYRCVLSYENPYFKVTVGSCLSEEEAVILLQNVKGEFPKSFITREKISPSEFALVEQTVQAPQIPVAEEPQVLPSAIQ